MARRSSNSFRRKVSPTDEALRKRCDGQIIGMRTSRWSWWTHWREIADYELPRRYRWLVTPNMQSRGSPINQHILDSSGTLAARNLAAGMMSGCTDPTKLWFRCKIDDIDSTQTSPVSLWLFAVEQKMRRIFHESNFYTGMATMYMDLVVFNTASVLVYEDYENVIRLVNPCLGEFYLANSANNTSGTFAREFTYTVQQTVEEFGYENCSDDVRQAWDEGSAELSREVIIAHLIETNTDPKKYGFPSQFTHREMYWQWGGSASPQGGSSSSAQGFLRKKGYFEDPSTPFLWDTVSNDPYGRGPGMDALPDIKQLQLETRRKAQAIDKLVNPPMIADIQMKNQPASLLPGGLTYVAGMMSTGKPGFAPVYQVQPPVGEIMEDLKEVKARIEKVFFNDLFRTASQFETRSNITAVEWDMRKSESLIMLGPVLNRLQTGFSKIFDRAFAIAARAGVFPPAPPEIQGKHIKIEFVSMLEQAQDAASASGIERLFQVIGNMAGIDPAVIDNVDIDFGIDKLSAKLNNDPRLIRSPDQLAQIRQAREAKQAQMERAAQAEQLAKAAKVASDTQVGGGQSALEAMIH